MSASGLQHVCILTNMCIGLHHTRLFFSHFAGILKSLITEDNIIPIRTIGSLAQEPLSFLGVSRERWLAHLPHGAWAQQGESPCEVVVLVMGDTGQLSLSAARRV